MNMAGIITIIGNDLHKMIFHHDTLSWLTKFTISRKTQSVPPAKKDTYMVISIFLSCNSVIFMPIGARSIKAIKGV